MGAKRVRRILAAHRFGPLRPLVNNEWTSPLDIVSVADSKSRGGLPTAKWEAALVVAAAAAAFGLAAANLGEPSLWHDELVHVYVGKSLADSGRPELPSGTPYWNGTAFNVLLAAVIRLFGMSESIVRGPSVLIGTINVLLLYAVVRRLLGSPAALLSAYSLALSPWTVAWAREARFYGLQQCLYLLFVFAFWEAAAGKGGRALAVKLGGAAVSYALAILTSFHSILFLGPVGVYAAAMAVSRRRTFARWPGMLCLIGLMGVLTIVSFYGLMNSLDRQAVFAQGGLGGGISDAHRGERFYYLNFLRRNLSVGFYWLAILGFAAMIAREGRRGFFAALAFWAPIVLLTFFIGYRRPRFAFFVFPFYVAAYSYGLVFLVEWVRGPKPAWTSLAIKVGLILGGRRAGLYEARRRAAWGTRLAILLVLLFAARLGVSAAKLTGDSIETAGGAHTTLARRHPQWRKPCLYIRAHGEDAVVVTTTYLPALYYAGRVDNWYPAAYIGGESLESGMDGLKSLADFQRYIAEHPKGFFVAEWWRFSRNAVIKDLTADLAAEVAWVEENLAKVEEASTQDVTLYAWGFDE